MSARLADVSLRGTAAVCALLSAGAHLLIAPEHLKEVAYIGVLFTVGGGTLLFTALGLAWRNPVPAWLLGVVVSGGMLLGFALSRTVGLPGYQDEGWDPPYGILCMVAEVVFIGAFIAWGCLYRLVRRREDTYVDRFGHPPSASVHVR
ncbi:hypothetical protein ABT168_32600 [Streptomyces sp. NPDC001793]|uniref:hypothetical protein n=1 Tax=Streptomyces sp. NPDC001793 TaxID=3154657 RepID=UPI00331DF2EA